jgi:hypothetical protein
MFQALMSARESRDRRLVLQLALLYRALVLLPAVLDL